MEPVPGYGESIYLWMYRQGLSGVNADYLLDQLRLNGKPIRQKDWDNYLRGLANHQPPNMFMPTSSCNPYFDLAYSEYPEHPIKSGPEIANRWVPCSETGAPLIKWGQGCMTKIDAMCMLNSKTLAENLRGTRMLVIDCDGDHTEGILDFETIRFLSKYMSKTHCLSKPKKVEEYNVANTPRDLAKLPASFHLTFKIDRIIPTMHFPKAHIDIVGNKANSLRYLKNKVWNNAQPIMMTDEIWKDIQEFIARRSQ